MYFLISSYWLNDIMQQQMNMAADIPCQRNSHDTKVHESEIALVSEDTHFASIKASCSAHPMKCTLRSHRTLLSSCTNGILAACVKFRSYFTWTVLRISPSKNKGDQNILCNAVNLRLPVFPHCSSNVSAKPYFSRHCKHYFLLVTDTTQARVNVTLYGIVAPRR